MFSGQSALGKVIRLPLRAIPRGTALPVLCGPNRGQRWVAGSHTHGCWLGVYERTNSKTLSGLVKPGMTVYDVGANVGYFSLMFSRLVGGQGKVIAFEPDPANIKVLRTHITINGIRNTDVVEAALSNGNGGARFSSNRAMGHLSTDGDLHISTMTLDEFPTPDFVKMDIEGAETLAMDGATRILSEKRTIWFVELHGTERQVRDRFSDHGYDLRAVGPSHLLALPTA
jgi:FkbM family methyltransferase